MKGDASIAAPAPDISVPDVAAPEPQDMLAPEPVESYTSIPVSTAQEAHAPEPQDMLAPEPIESYAPEQDNDSAQSNPQTVRASDIATKAELDHLIETRPTPEREMHLTPMGPVTSVVNRQVAVVHEKRIVDLNERLERMRDTVERDFSLSRQHGHARADFERSR